MKRTGRTKAERAAKRLISMTNGAHAVLPWRMAASIRLTAVKKTDRSEGPRNCRRAWNYDLTNADKECPQIHLRPRDMLKLGVLFAQDGRWHGKQVISSAWVNLAC